MSLGLLELELISQATLVEIDPLVYAFWKCIKEQPENLCSRIKKVDVSLSTWSRFQKYLVPNALRSFKLLDLGLAGLFFNRTNFSGIIAAGPIGGMSQASEYKLDCRFNKSRIIDQICRIAAVRSKLQVVYGDALAVLSRRERSLRNEHCLVYLDPPYYKQGPKLYRYNYKHAQHKALADFIGKKTYPWVVSYDSHPKVKELFVGQKITTVPVDYVIKKSRKANELLISNLNLGSAVYVQNHAKVKTQSRCVLVHN